MRIGEFYDLSDAALANEFEELAEKISLSPSTFGLDVPAADSLIGSAEEFKEMLVNWHGAKNAYINASYEKTTVRDAASANFATCLKLMYATPTVTGGAITSLGLKTRPVGRSPLVPAQPQSLLAVPSADGTVKLKWKKGQNKYGVVYQIETVGADSAEWIMVQSTTQTKITLSGHTPGVPRWFRVRASATSGASEYSLPSGIYIPMPESSSAVRMAA